MRLGFPLIWAAIAAAAVWDDSVWQRPRQIGGSGGGPFTIVGAPGTTVQKLSIYRSDPSYPSQYIRGIRVVYSDGGVALAGAETDDVNEITFQPNERVTKMSLWDDGRKKHAGRIQFQTDKGNVFDFGQKTDGQNEVHISVGSGILIGFVGLAGLDIDAMSPVFIKDMKSTRVEDVSFPPFDVTQGFTLKTLKEIEAKANGSEWVAGFHGTEQYESSTKWKLGVSASLSVTTSVTAGIPLIASAGLQTSWTIGVTSEHEGEEKKSSSLTWDTEVKIDRVSQRYA
jgi:hypothetical protein